MRQDAIKKEGKMLYLSLQSQRGDKKNVYPMLPDLDHNQHYFCLNKNFVTYICNHSCPPTKRIDIHMHTQEEFYYMKLVSAMTCAKLSRWSECFAHCLSALDVYDEDCDYLHDVFCFMAQSAYKMSVDLEWCCNILQRAKMLSCPSALDQTWKRLITFQGLLIEQGIFDLEDEMFAHSIKFFVQPTKSFEIFVRQHIEGKLAQVENNLAFQYVRQKFHDDCEEFCDKEPCLEQSFETTKKCWTKSIYGQIS